MSVGLCLVVFLSWCPNGSVTLLMAVARNFAWVSCMEFEGAKKSHAEVVDSILFEVASWAVASNDIYGVSISDITRGWYTCILCFTLS